MKKNMTRGLLIVAALSLVPTPRMANSLGALSGALILQEALAITFTQRPLLKTIAMGMRDLDGRVDNALLNQSVTTRIQVPATVNNFGTGPVDVTDTDVTVALTSRKEMHVAFTPTQINSTDRNFIKEAAKPFAIGLANHIIDTVAALWLNANYAGKKIVASGWTYNNTLRVLKKALDDAGVAVDDRFFTANSAVYDALLGDTMVVTALNNPMNANAIMTGVLPKVLGLGIAQYNQLPGNSENLIGVAGTPDSLVYVARAPKNPEDMAGGLRFPGVQNYVEDPVTGFRVLVQQWIDPSTEIVNNRVSWLEGFAVGNPNNLVRLVTA